MPKPVPPDYSKALVRRLIGNKGGGKPSAVFVVAHEKYGKPTPKGKC